MNKFLHLARAFTGSALTAAAIAVSAQTALPASLPEVNKTMPRILREVAVDIDRTRALAFVNSIVDHLPDEYRTYLLENRVQFKVVRGQLGQLAESYTARNKLDLIVVNFQDEVPNVAASVKQHVETFLKNHALPQLVKN